MRTKRFLCAALAAAGGFWITACFAEQIVNVKLPESQAGAIASISGTTKVNGESCSWTLSITTSAQLTNGNLVQMPGDTANLAVVQSSTNDCLPDQGFNWLSKNPVVAKVDGTGPKTAREVAIAVGATQVCAAGQTDAAVTGCANVTVQAVTPNCTVTGVLITGPATSIQGGGSVQLSATVQSNPAGCATQGVTWSATGVGSVSQNGLLTSNGTAGNIVVVARSKDNPNISDTFTVTVNVVPPNQVVVAPNLVTVGSGAACVLTRQFTATTVPGGLTGTWSKTNHVAGATLNASNGVYSFPVNATGTDTVTFTATAGGSGFGVIVVTNTACGSTSQVDSVTITPKTWNLVVGGPDIFLTTTVWGSPGISQAVTVNNSQPGCTQITQTGNQIRVRALTACTNNVITATSVVDNSKSGTSVGSVSSGTVVCTITSATTGAVLDNTTVVVPAGTTSYVVNVTCTNQNNVSFLPWGETNLPTIATITGSTTVNINGQNWPAGSPFTISRVSAGSAVITFHASITDKTVLKSFTITFQ